MSQAGTPTSVISVMRSPRTYVRVDLALDSQWRVGTWRYEEHSGDDRHEDRLVVATVPDPLDPSAPYVPGSSVRGAIRAHLRNRLGHERTEEVFGPEAPDSGEDGGEEESALTASRWWVLGTRVVPGSWSEIRERGQTAMDRVRRAPQQGSFRLAKSVVPTGEGPHLQVYLRCDAPPTDAVAADVLRALTTWKPHVGGGRTVGMGRARVVRVVHRGVGADRDSLLKLLLVGGGPDGVQRLLDEGTVVDLAQPVAGPTLLTASFAVKDGWEASEPRDVVDGSTWKGLIRSRVEFIGRSLGHPVCDAEATGQAATTGQCDVCTAFGSPQHAGTLEFAITPIGRGSSTSVTPRKRNALDRFTGGVGKQLFDEVCEDGIRVSLEISGDGDVPAWVPHAVAHAIRDLADGLVGFGHRSSTGLGTLEANTVTAGGAWREVLAPDRPADENVSAIALDDLRPVPMPAGAVGMGEEE